MHRKAIPKAHQEETGGKVSLFFFYPKLKIYLIDKGSFYILLQNLLVLYIIKIIIFGACRVALLLTCTACHAILILSNC